MEKAKEKRRKNGKPECPEGEPALRAKIEKTERAREFRDNHLGMIRSPMLPYDHRNLVTDELHCILRLFNIPEHVFMLCYFEKIRFQEKFSAYDPKVENKKNTALKRKIWNAAKSAFYSHISKTFDISVKFPGISMKHATHVLENFSELTHVLPEAERRKANELAALIVDLIPFLHKSKGRASDAEIEQFREMCMESTSMI